MYLGSWLLISWGFISLGIRLNSKAEHTFLHWVPVDRHLCPTRLNRTIRTRKDRYKRRFLLNFTNWSSDGIRDKLYIKLSAFISKPKTSDVVIVRNDLNAKVGSLNQTEKYSRFNGVVVQRTDNSDHLMQLCLNNGLFLANSNIGKRHPLTLLSTIIDKKTNLKRLYPQ